MIDTERMSANVRVAKAKADSWIDENLDGDEDAKAAVESTASSFGRMDDRGQATAGGAMQVVSLVVALTVGAIIAAFLLPIGIEELTSADLGEGASEGADALWGILDVVIVLAVFLFFIAVALAAADRV